MYCLALANNSYTAITKQIPNFDNTMNGVLSNPIHQNNQYVDFNYDQNYEFVNIEKLEAEYHVVKNRFRDLDVIIFN